MEFERRFERLRPNPRTAEVGDSSSSSSWSRVEIAIGSERMIGVRTVMESRFLCIVGVSILRSGIGDRTLGDFLVASAM